MAVGTLSPKQHHVCDVLAQVSRISFTRYDSVVASRNQYVVLITAHTSLTPYVTSNKVAIARKFY